MISIDTNVVIRVVVMDDPDQVESARQLMSRNVCFVSRGVVQEIVWVLTRTYKLPKIDVLVVLNGLRESEQIVLEDEVIIDQAISWYHQGFDFADALHLASSKDCVGLATFDQAFIKAAAAIHTSIPVNHP